MLYQSVAPTDYLVTLEQLKAHLAIDDSDSDDRLNNLLATSRDLIEHDSGLCFTSQTWVETLSRFPSVYVAGKLPIETLTINYYDSDNSAQELDEAEYYLLRSATSTKVVPVNSWPATYVRPDAVSVTLAINPESVPPMAKQACLLLCGAWQELREGESLVATNEIKLGYERLIRSLRGSYLC